ncbi:hypothetical protein Q4493_13790 [Colwellia sp. 1_MG-2023]|uniref:hypothetical protein n=1 Tax=Colwellia sp. 1_MG-2023 TaxID=3062649 RepID=UPI0026E1A4DC|nr:hypothetical protein [Colwellia sp. 1_MG-2023]MDO6446847.1 hypothetical protein [Colwellia sp. 1_MG-2023]
MSKLMLILMMFFTSYTAFAESNKQPEDAILLTIFLKHDQSNSFEEYQNILEKQEFFEKFPPKGVAVVSWYVMMGIGQVVTLQVPAHKLREVNLAVEKSAWKAFTAEFYPTYDLYPVFKDKLKNKEKVSY